MNAKKTTFITFSALMVALSVILAYFPEIPLGLAAAPWLKLDFSFVPLLLLGFLMGPGAVLLGVLVTNLIRLLGSTTGGVGEIANALMALSFILPSALMYQGNRTIKTAIIGSVIGILAMIVMGVLANRYVLVPLVLGEKLAAFDMASYLIRGIVPFNLVKGALNTAIAFLVYKRLSTVIKRVAARGE